jgi:hypothetical protein
LIVAIAGSARYAEASMGRRPQPGHGRMRNRLKATVGSEWLAPQRMWPTPATCPIASTMTVWQQDLSQRWRLHQKGGGRIVELIDRAARV